MMCYRDRTYCDAPCVNAECSRLVTPEIRAAAVRRRLPLALADFRETCGRFVAAGAPAGKEGT